MKINIEMVVWLLVFVDAIGANLVAWFGSRWYSKHFAFMSRYFPATKGWTVYYLLLVIWIGLLLFR